MGPLEIILEDGKRVQLQISKGLALNIFPLEDAVLNLDDLHLVTSIAFVYIGMHQRDMILTPETVKNYGVKLYHAFYKYHPKHLKSLADMNIDEFNQFMKRYNGRK